MAHAPTHAGLDRSQHGLDGVAFERSLAFAAGHVVGGLALACGGLLLMRRLAGAMAVPAGGLNLVAVCAVGWLFVAVGDLAARAGHGSQRIAPRIGLLMAVAAMAMPIPTGPAAETAIATAALAFAVAVLAQPWVRPLQRAAVGRLARWTAPSPRRAVDAPLRTAAEPPAAEPPPLPVVAAGEHVLQQFARFTLADGTESVRARLFLAVPAGVRTASGHIGFCPPFAVTPIVDVTTDYDEVEAVVAAGEVLPWGVRVECRLDEAADDPFEIPIDVHARSLPPTPTVP